MDQQPFNNQPPQNQGQNPPPVNSPFETPPASAPAPVAPPPQNMPPTQSFPAGGYQPVGMEPAKGKSSLILIIVLVIILILGGLVFASWEGWINLGSIQNLWKKSSTTTTTTPVSTTTTTTTNANDQQRKTDLANLKSALAKYYQANQSYPVAATLQKTLDPNNVLAVLIPTYISKLPTDPLSPTYYYGYLSDGKTYTITAVLEDKTDPTGIQQGTNYIYKVTNTSTETPSASSSSTSTSTNSSSSTTTTNQ